ncbi:TRAP transporter small permease [uncultured Roseibium sp.]|uniref:TRAP transporter small permease n=1 Tax=uncultured Roseibium sp. TaxID=1936171 RepID=UPI0032170696
MTKLANLYSWTVGLLMRIAVVIAFVSICVAVAITLVDIVLRSMSRLSVALTGEGLTWAVPGLVDLTQLLVMIAASMAIAVAFHRGAHVAIDLIDNMFPPLMRKFNALLAVVIAVWFLGACLWYGIGEMQGQLELNTASSTLSISYLWYWLPLIAGMALSVLGALDAFLGSLFGHRPVSSEAEHYDV